MLLLVSRFTSACDSTCVHPRPLAMGTSCTHDFVESSCIPEALSCNWYLTCLDACIPCGSDGYAQAYGNYYCQKFLDAKFTEEEVAWRDSVLICLQKALFAHLEEDVSCDQIKRLAFDSHPACYTLQGHSICDLSFESQWRILQIVLPGLVSDPFYFSRQTWATLQTCGLWSSFSKVLKFVLEPINEDQGMPDFQSQLSSVIPNSQATIVVLNLAMERLGKRQLTAYTIVVGILSNPAGNLSITQVQDALVSAATTHNLLRVKVAEVSDCPNSDCSSTDEPQVTEPTLPANVPSSTGNGKRGAIVDSFLLLINITLLILVRAS